ncbi:MAG TPA: hypothetical protein VIM19_05855 [Actinomycetes bacterium]
MQRPVGGRQPGVEQPDQRPDVVLGVAANRPAQQREAVQQRAAGCRHQGTSAAASPGSRSPA